MKFIIENWKKFLTEQNISEEIFQDIWEADQKVNIKRVTRTKSKFAANTILTNNFVSDSGVGVIGIGNDKIVFSHEQSPNYVFKTVRNDHVTNDAGMEVDVWEEFRNTPLANILAPIYHSEKSPVYAMKKAKGGGSNEEIEDFLWNLSQKDKKYNFRDLKYYFMGDVHTPGNVMQLDGKSVLVDYDAVYGFKVSQDK